MSRAVPTWAAACCMFLLLFTVFGFSAKGASSVDDYAPAVEAWAIASSGSPWLEDSLDEDVRRNPWIHEAPNGHVVADRMAGPTVIALPFYWLLGDASFDLGPAGLAAACVTAGTATLMFLALRRKLSSFLSSCVALAFALATPTWSVSANGPWTHTVTQFAIAGAAYGASRRAWWVVGVFLGFGIWGRPHVALIAAILGLGVSWWQRSPRPAIKVAIPCTAAVALLLLWNRWMFGIWAVTSAGYVSHVRALVPGAAHPATRLVNYAGFLIAPDRGLLVWTPVILLFFPALVRGRKHLPVWSWWLAVGGLVYTVVQLELNVFHGGDSFYAYRLGLELLTCVTPLLGYAVPWLGRPARALVPVVIALQFGAILFGAVSETAFVNQSQVWRDNSFLMAVRTIPIPLTILMLACLGMGLVGARMAVARPDAAIKVGAPLPSGARVD